MIDQSGGSWHRSTAEAFAKASEALQEQLRQVEALYDPTPGEPVLVPDANAIVWNPALEEWTFDDVPRFSIVLTPTLLGELDDLKMRHRADSVREKAESAIRRIKEYRRRGDIRTGVPLKRGVSSVRMVAIEPDFDAALPWLDRDVKDDRLIAATLEIVREHPHSPVLLITRDANVENKADLADVPFLEPPDPPADPPEPPQRQEARPDIRLFDLQATGGGDRLTFAARVQNYGQRPARATFKASIDGQEVSWRPEVMDLLVNAPPTLLYIEVPRAELGDLVHEFAQETTLYGRTLELEIYVEGELATSAAWSEKVYDPETNRERYEIQQRIWRIGRGEDTEQTARRAPLSP